MSICVIHRYLSSCRAKSRVLTGMDHVQLESGGPRQRHPAAYRVMVASGRGGGSTSLSGGDSTFVPAGALNAPTPVIPRESLTRRREPMGNTYLTKKIDFKALFMFVNTVINGTILVIVLVLVAWVLNNKAVVVQAYSALSARAVPFEQTARNVNDIMKALRTVYGDELFKGSIPASEDPPPPDTDDGSIIISAQELRCRDARGTRQWYRMKCDELSPKDGGARSSVQEGFVNVEIARTAVHMFKTFETIMSQVAKSKSVQVVTGAVKNADKMATSPQVVSLISTVSAAVQHPEAKTFAFQTVSILSHIEKVVLPIIDVLADEIRDEIEALMEDAEQGYAHALFRKYLLEWADIMHKVGVGLRNMVVWYQDGGPSDAASLLNDLVLMGKELVESPAAKSFVQVVEAIDWKETGQELRNTARDITAIVSEVRQANSVEAVDGLVRSLGRLLKDPSTTRAIAMLPGVVANITALAARNSSQTLVREGSRFLTQMGMVLAQAEVSHAVERSADFMGVLRTALGGLVDGGLHVELGQIDGTSSSSSSSSHADQYRHQSGGASQPHQQVSKETGPLEETVGNHAGNPRLVVPHYKGIEPESDRHNPNYHRKRRPNRST